MKSRIRHIGQGVLDERHWTPQSAYACN